MTRLLVLALLVAALLAPPTGADNALGTYAGAGTGKLRLETLECDRILVTVEIESLPSPFEGAIITLTANGGDYGWNADPFLIEDEHACLWGSFPKVFLVDGSPSAGYHFVGQGQTLDVGPVGYQTPVRYASESLGETLYSVVSFGPFS